MVGQLTFLVLTVLSTMASCLPAQEKRDPMNGKDLQWYQIRDPRIYDGYTQIGLYAYQGWRWDGSEAYPRIHMFSHIVDEANRCKRIPDRMRDRTCKEQMGMGGCRQSAEQGS
ncbi:hypothetical protein BZA77DRAFT_294615 [Pyronema omphalodes]|nr:hypothetical protein BZA77DRAFT_294615 [Pyronema omphalodes]